MNISQIEANIQSLFSDFSKETFIYDFLLAYGTPNSTIQKLKIGTLNLSKVEGEISWKKKMFFKEDLVNDLHDTIDEIKNLETLKKDTPRFIIVTDFEDFLAFDTKTLDTLDIKLVDLITHYSFFLPLAKMEKIQHLSENPADVRAAVKMAKLFDEIKIDNPENTPDFNHNLNVFLSRLLFCFFAEDTNIFKDDQFTSSVSSFTQFDGSDLNEYLDKLFEVLNTPYEDRKNLPVYLNDFPYVNGGLFKVQIKSPNFTSKSRKILIESGGGRDWSEINPDIFGSMFQAVIRGLDDDDNTKHYTSVVDILKVIKPLFLDDLYSELEKSKGNLKKLQDLITRISKLKVFDPACGSGNFLIIAYKELRKLEIYILEEIKILNGTVGLASLDFGSSYLSSISLNNFYGIELDDFAHEIAKLALWLAEHQMNLEFFKVFGKTNPTLPLKDAGQITLGNASRLDWTKVCPISENDEIYIIGNPPYQGSNKQSLEQKEDMSIVFSKFKNYKNLDYIAIWFYKSADFIQNINAQFALVSTNSICQGEQVELLWPSIFDKKLEIGFAHTSFKWKNNAKENAGVSVIIIGVRNINNYSKFIFSDNRVLTVNNINAYLTNGGNVIVRKRSKLLSLLPEMTYGNKAVYGEPLILNTEEKENLILNNYGISKYIKKFIGAKELLDNLERWVIWIRNDDLENSLLYKPLQERIENVKKLRLLSNEKGANELALKPHQFRDTFETITNSVVVPLTTSERRVYLPLGFTSNEEILSNAVSVIYNTEHWIFSIISSKIHMLWIKAVCGSLETRIRYSSVLGYNTFPFPTITELQKQELEQCVYRILDEREAHSEKTLAQKYDPDKMPDGLREVHRLNDLAVERCYRSKPFETDEERLEYLFKLYEQMIAEEKTKGTLFAEEKKAKKTKKK